MATVISSVQIDGIDLSLVSEFHYEADDVAEAFLNEYAEEIIDRYFNDNGDDTDDRSSREYLEALIIEFAQGTVFEEIFYHYSFLVESMAFALENQVIALEGGEVRRRY